MKREPSAPIRSLRHELRTPLNQIIGYCEMILEESEQPAPFPELVPDLQRIHQAGRALLGVVEDILDSTKSASYQESPSLLDHDVRTPLNQILGYAEMLQELALECGRQPLADDLHRIHAAARDLNGRIFEHFRLQGHPPASSSCDRPSAGQAGAAGRRSAGAGGWPGVVGSILIADDDEANRTMLARRLARLGHRVGVAANGREALDHLRAARFDLLLLDICMPEMDGFTVLQAMKADPELGLVPVVVLSASVNTDQVAHCIELGAEDYLPKPFDAVLLQARIVACLEKKQLRDREVSHLKQIEEEKQRLQMALASLELARREAALLDDVTQKINAGLGLQQVLEHIYASFEPVLPYDRVGCALIEPGGGVVRARWARSRLGRLCLPVGHGAPLAGSSLHAIVETGHPRIINDLQEYLRSHPRSASTRLIVEEGMRSSLTCPLISMGTAVGFLFFSSTRPGAYHESHVGAFMRVSNHVSTIVQKGLLYDEVGEELHRSEERFAHTQAQLVAAQQIQKRLLPSSAPSAPGLDIAGACYPSYFAAGDYFNYLPAGDGSLVLVIADVTGHGVGPALVAAAVHAHLKSLVEDSCPIDRIAHRLNARLCQETETHHFVTMLLVLLEPGLRSLRYVNAGHPVGYVMDASGSAKTVMGGIELPLGIDPGADYTLSDPVALCPGDLVFLMTDGIFEACSPEDEAFGLPRTEQILSAEHARPAGELIGAVRDAVLAFSQRKIPQDDMTMVAVKVTGAP